MGDKNRFNGLKENIQNDIQGKILVNMELDGKIDKLQQTRTQMLIELDKVMSMFEQSEKEKVELIKKIQMLQGLEGVHADHSFVVLHNQQQTIKEDDEKNEEDASESLALESGLSSSVPQDNYFNQEPNFSESKFDTEEKMGEVKNPYD